jgi:hypothetical protein
LLPTNLIISSFKMYEYCKKRYPNRIVEASPYPDYDDFYYITKTNHVRLVRRKNEIWILGSECPEILRRR